MKSFVPDDPQSAGSLQKRLIEHLRQNGFPVKDRTIQRIEFRDLHNPAKNLQAEVGHPDPMHGETVVAIFESGESFLICTERRNPLEGQMPIIIGRDQVLNVVEFGRPA
jgi:hypothetical protein